VDPRRVEAVLALAPLAPDVRCEAMFRAASVLAAQHPRRATAMFGRAKAWADEVLTEGSRWWCQARFAVATRKTSARAAAKLARNLAKTATRDGQRAELVPVVARDDLPGAWVLINAITDPRELGRALAELALVEHETDADAARATLDDATDVCAATSARLSPTYQTLVLSSDGPARHALVRAALAVFGGDPAATLAYFSRVPSDRGRDSVPSLLVRQLFPTVQNASTATLTGYIHARGGDARFAGTRADAQSHLGNMLQYANGVLIALVEAKHPVAASAARQISDTVLRLWPAPTP
jgi:hypothetical protein